MIKPSTKSTAAPSCAHAGPEVEDEDHIGETFHRFQALKHSDLVRAVENFANFKAGLIPRIRWEEQEVFPAFIHRVGGGLAGTCDTLRQEHQQVVRLLEAIEAKLARSNPATDAEEAALQRLLVAHNHKEHDVIFPALE